jgi:hypothetical protein
VQISAITSNNERSSAQASFAKSAGTGNPALPSKPRKVFRSCAAPGTLPSPFPQRFVKCSHAMKPLARTPLTLLLVMASAATSSAFVVKLDRTGVGCRWNLQTPDQLTNTSVINWTTRAIRYTLASDACSATNVAAELNAVRAAFAQWQAVPGTHLRFEDAGLVAPPLDINTSDHTNVVYWEKKSLMVNGGRDYLGGKTGYTVVRDDTNRHAILEADIVFNAVEKQWVTDCATPSSFAKPTCIGAVALHEIGHLVGLEHSPLGGATMFFRAAAGEVLQAGLSVDDISAVRSLYPSNTTDFGAISGRVTKNQRPVLGAAVFVHDAAGCAVTGTVTAADGCFLMSMLPPGKYQVHAAPIDPPAANRLCAGADIALAYSRADTTFLPTSDRSTTLTAGGTNALDFAVASGVPAFRITSIRTPAANASSCSWSSLPTSLRAGEKNLTVGVASTTLPTDGATLTITGDGLTLGKPTFLTNAFRSGLNFISANVSVATNATPGLRTFVVRQGGNVAYAHGFLEILPAR